MQHDASGNLKKKTDKIKKFKKFMICKKSVFFFVVSGSIVLHARKLFLKINF